MDGRSNGTFGGFGNCLFGKHAFKGAPICYVPSDSMCEDKVYDPEVDKHYSWKACQKFKGWANYEWGGYLLWDKECFHFYNS